jgi:hypothetical protein
MSKPTSTKRRPRVLPHGLTEAEWFQVQAVWDDEAKRSGLKDIESGRDSNRYPTSTLPGAHGLAFVPLSAESNGDGFDSTHLHEQANADIFGEPTAVADTPQALLWRDVAATAHRLPAGYRHRSLVLDWATNGKITTQARKHGIGRFSALRSIKRFCREHGFDYDQLSSSADVTRGHDDFVDPCVKDDNGYCVCAGPRPRSAPLKWSKPKAPPVRRDVYEPEWTYEDAE